MWISKIYWYLMKLPIKKNKETDAKYFVGHKTNKKMHNFSSHSQKWVDISKTENEPTHFFSLNEWWKTARKI